MQHISQVFREYEALKRIEKLASDIKKRVPKQAYQKSAHELSSEDFSALALSQREADLMASQILHLVKQILEEK